MDVGYPQILIISQVADLSIGGAELVSGVENKLRRIRLLLFFLCRFVICRAFNVIPSRDTGNCKEMIELEA